MSAAIAEVGSPEACLVLIENPRAGIAPFSLDRIVERFGHLGAVREAMLARAKGSLYEPRIRKLIDGDPR